MLSEGPSRLCNVLCVFWPVLTSFAFCALFPSGFCMVLIFVIFDSYAAKALVVSHIGFMNKVLIQSQGWTLV